MNLCDTFLFINKFQTQHASWRFAYHWYSKALQENKSYFGKDPIFQNPQTPL